MFEMNAGRGAQNLLVTILLFACSTDMGLPPPTKTTQKQVETTTTPVTTTPASTTTSATNNAGSGGLRLWSVDPARLSVVEGSAMGPVGWWVGTVIVTERETAFVAYSEDSAAWTLWLANRETMVLTEVAHGTSYDPSTGYLPPLSIAIGVQHIDWVSHLELRASDPNVPDGLVVRRFDRRSEEVTTLFEIETLGFYADRATGLSEGRWGIFGRSLADNIPRVIVLDLGAQEFVVDVELDTDPPVINTSNRDEFGWVEPAWDRTNGLLYVPHLYSDFITSVDLNSGTAATNQVSEKPSFLDRLLAAWVPTAHAKGASSQMIGALAPDGATLYLTGKTIHWVDGPVADDYREMPAGIVAVDTETMTEVARADLPVDHFAMSADGKFILAAGWWEEYVGGPMPVALPVSISSMPTRSCP